MAFERLRLSPRKPDSLGVEARQITFGVRTLMVAGGFLLATAVGISLSSTCAGRSVQAASKSSREAGALVFHQKGCEHCHGADGLGTEKGPDLSMVGKRRNKPQIEHQIISGGNGMPAFGDALQPDEVKVLVDYLSAKRKAPKQTQ
jgi:mono/diheme cytochrome c family protein